MPILVVEDDEAIREAVRKILEAEGFPVVSARNGLEALTLLTGILSPRIILLDMMMPIMDGESFLNRLRQDEALSRIPIVVMSASDRPVLSTTAYLPKPFRCEDLISAVRRHSKSLLVA